MQTRHTSIFDGMLEEHANEISLTDLFAEDAKGKEGNQYQEPDDGGGEKLIEMAASHFSQRVHDLPAMHKAHDNLFEGIQDEQQGKESE